MNRRFVFFDSWVRHTNQNCGLAKTFLAARIVPLFPSKMWAKFPLALGMRLWHNCRMIDPILILLILVIGVLLGFGFFAMMFVINKEANHQAMDERGLGRRRPKQ